MARHNYTLAQIEWLRARVENCTFPDLAEQFNRHFKTDLNMQAIKSFCHRRGLNNNRAAGLHRAGIGPWNKGVKGLHLSPSTEFKPGQRPHNWQPIGYERVGKSGIIEVKISEEKRGGRQWKSKQALVYEQHHGKIPPGHFAIFADGDNRNFSPDNIVLVSAAEHVHLNKAGFRKQPKELRPAILNLIRLENRMRQLAEVSHGA